jgi:hypothetical protein
MNNWGKEYNKMAEENEFYGLPYDDNTDKLIKQFISDLRKKDMEELIKIMEERINRRKFLPGRPGRSHYKTQFKQPYWTI